MVNKEEIFSFQKKFSLETRLAKFKEIEGYLNECVPIIIEEIKTSHNSSTQTNTFLVSSGTTFGQMVDKIKQRRIVNPEQAIFFLINGKNAVSLSTTLKSAYEKYKHEDGFLYVSYSLESVWG